MKKIQVLVVVIGLMLMRTSPATEQLAFPEHGLDAVVFHLVAKQSDGAEATLGAEVWQKIVFNFPTISGGIFGSPDPGQERFLLFADDQQQLVYDLSAETKRAKKAAQKLHKRYQSLGLSVEPKRTKLARLGTFGYYLGDQVRIGGSGVFEMDTDNHLILVYFSRKCTVKGDIVLGDEVYKHDITIPNKGFYWLRNREVKPGVFQMDRAANLTDVELRLITLPDESTVSDEV